jgi:glycosyltransferase involved in cell wall biosynthesis
MAPELADSLDDLDLTDEVARLSRRAEYSTSPHPSIPRRASALVGRKEHLFTILKQADEIVAPSRFLQSVFEGQGFPKGRLRHIPYGVDARRFGTARRPSPPGGETALHLGYVGSLTSHKGVHVLIEAVRSICSERVRLHIHGSLDADPAYSSTLRKSADADSRIVFHSAFEPDALGQVLATLDLLVVPSLWYENTPFSVLEALHARLPVIASDLGGITEVVEHGTNGLLFSAGDRDSLANTIQAVLDDPSRLPRLAVGPGPHTIEENLDAFEALYAPLLEGAVEPQ